MFEDRLRPRCLNRDRRRLNVEMCEDSPRPQATSPGQRKARAIVRKYRRNVRYAQLHRLKSLVPAVAEREEATEVSTRTLLCSICLFILEEVTEVSTRMRFGSLFGFVNDFTDCIQRNMVILKSFLEQKILLSKLEMFYL